MIKNIIFDFGAVLVDWNPHYLYVPYFGDAAKAEWFLTEICPYDWNAQCDAGRPIKDITAERVALFPEWEKEIRMYFDRWVDMMGGPIPGMYDLVRDFKQQGYGIYGLTNWAAETFYTIVNDYPVFALLDGMVVSGDVRLLKPDAAIFHCLLDKYGLKAKESLFIDDTLSNVEGARAAGLSALPFTDARTLRADLRRLLIS